MNFIKTFFAALLALVVGLGLIVMIWTMIAVGLVSALGSSPAVAVHSGSVLRLDPGTVTDSPQISPLDGFDLRRMALVRRTTLLDAIRSIRAAADDERIKGIYINVDENTSASIATLEEIRA
jgi:protease-4